LHAQLCVDMKNTYLFLLVTSSLFASNLALAVAVPASPPPPPTGQTSNRGLNKAQKAISRIELSILRALNVDDATKGVGDAVITIQNAVLALRKVIATQKNFKVRARAILALAFFRQRGLIDDAAQEVAKQLSAVVEVFGPDTQEGVYARRYLMDFRFHGLLGPDEVPLNVLATFTNELVRFAGELIEANYIGLAREDLRRLQAVEMPAEMPAPWRMAMRTWRTTEVATDDPEPKIKKIKSNEDTEAAEPTQPEFPLFDFGAEEGQEAANMNTDFQPAEGDNDGEMPQLEDMPTWLIPVLPAVAAAAPLVVEVVKASARR